MLSLILLF